MFLSPFFMVRLLTVEQFGEYRDFLLYGAILFTVVEFGIHSSLAYFVPREPSRQRLYFTQAAMFVFFTSTIAAVLVLLFSNYAPSEVIREYKYALFLYTLFLCNLDAWEVWWIARKQTINILYYSLTRLTARTAIVIVAAYYSRQVSTVIWSLVIFEAIRLIVMTGYAVKQRLLIAEFNSVTLRAQLAFFGPLGLSNVMYAANIYMGQFYISAVMGPAMLGMYTIGTYLYPIIHIFRSSIGDVIMPEIASKTDEPAKVALVLWQRATVVYCVVMMPMAVLFFYYADVFVSVLFTEAYADAIPVFQVFVLLLVRECFDFSLPLRVVNRTKVFFHVVLVTAAVNLGLMLLLFEYYGIVGPALAIVISRFLAGIAFAAYVMKYCDYTVAGLLPWVDIGKVVLLCLACVSVLLIGDMIEIGALVRSLLFASIYSVVYLTLLMKLGIDDVREFILRLLKRTR
jgi:O-antigen/teichoic acid export membrane protein